MAEWRKPRVLPEKEVISAGNGKSGHETFAPKTLGKLREVPWCSNLLTELQRERRERLFSLVDPLHVLQCVQFGYSLNKDVKFWSRKARPVEKRSMEYFVGARCRWRKMHRVRTAYFSVRCATAEST